MFIVIGGTVGVGKSTVSKALEKKLIDSKYKTLLEPEPVASSPYLVKYYEDPVKWTLIAQLDFLLLRHKQLLSALEESDKNDYIIFDRYLTEDYVFANMHSTKKNMPAFNSLAYHAIYNNILEQSEITDNTEYFFLLKAPFESIVKRVKGRGIKMEQDVDLEYWKQLYDMYYNSPWVIEHFKKHSQKLIEIDADKPVDEIVNEIYKVITKKK